MGFEMRPANLEMFEDVESRRGESRGPVIPT